MNATRVELLGLPLDPVTMPQAAAWVRAHLEGSRPVQVVTLNPEIVVRSRRDPELRRALREAELVTPDGVGVLWAARRLLGLRLAERVTGIDLTLRLFEELGPQLNVFLLGGRPGVAERAAAAAEAHGVRVAGTHHGYFDRADPVIEAVARSGANLLLAGMGERQETFLWRHKPRLGVPVMIGVGGTLDVLAGEARRTPVWSRRLGIEWLLRVGLDPKRWPRALRLLRFVIEVERARRLPPAKR
ncbi:N-acetylmannosaminyltransferase [Oceanithermus profundus DSM 14977]|uniref:N-acetylmannosaminyltransferase n=1 Tax=Oceanithermus profundus (strain DSM 14977 / NBRC 100410 / VKM B-2274 / 506) TaxID=670487 RepID=E4U851_OCEP5|nr:WecB/TagA/CpsF family glycosyltransferase [Oceanithermus profundus]ADR36266.1 N-acetylmannosaminyltransferase [Oceanithermus profundus DSM 14977]